MTSSLTPHGTAAGDAAEPSAVGSAGISVPRDVAAVWRRRLRIVLPALAALVAVLVAVPLAFTFPASADAPGRSDAIVVLGPATPARLALAERLMESGAAKTLVISEYSQLWAPRVPPCEGERPSYEVVCFIAMPETTQGEAQQLRQLAKERGWTSVQVITFAPHVNRARIIVGRCFAGDVRVLEAGTDPWGAQDLMHHLAGWYKVALSTEC